MIELPARITSGFWREKLDLNATAALGHQWDQLEASLCIDNFRIAAGEKQGFREGFFFANSDAYKWLDAASLALADRPDPALAGRVDAFTGLLERAQQPDGYLYTYNQIHFPGSRWENLQVEHEFYCLGHLIEAGIAHAEATGGTRLLEVARRAADLLVREFSEAPSRCTDGHEEIEIALLRLSETTGEAAYRELARRLLERRGRIPAFPLVFLPQALRTTARMKARDRMRDAYLQAHPEHQKPRLPSRALRSVPAGIQLRLAASLLSGKYSQQNAPLREQTAPAGHAVRFTYLAAAAARLARLEKDASLLEPLARLWERMVTRRMYVTGGIGSLPLIEGFGRDYELHPEIAYNETCAALGSMLWSWQMLLATGQARYADLFEWQLYNAASSSMGLDGRGYFYDNPLASRGELARAAWYDVPCCPSNLSRAWASFGQHLLTQDGEGVWVQQYASARAAAGGIALSIETGLPWEGRVRLRVEEARPDLRLHLRIPSWAGGYELRLNGRPVDAHIDPVPVQPGSACGYSPHGAAYLHVDSPLQAGDLLELDLSLPVRVYRQDRRVPGCGGQAAFGRGPLIYCLESVDNPGLDLFAAAIRAESLRPVSRPDLLGGCVVLEGETAEGGRVRLVPYMLWANRGPGTMNVFARPV